MPTVFVLNMAGVLSLQAPGGSVFRFTHQIGLDTFRFAQVGAPSRTGRLVRGIQRPETRSYGLFVTSRVWSTARHTMWVHQGTRTPITRPGGGFMPIHNATRTAIITYRQAVRGQQANPFLATALNKAFWLNMGR